MTSPITDHFALGNNLSFSWGVIENIQVVTRQIWYDLKDNLCD